MDRVLSQMQTQGLASICEDARAERQLDSE